MPPGAPCGTPSFWSSFCSGVAGGAAPPTPPREKVTVQQFYFGTPPRRPSKTATPRRPSTFFRHSLTAYGFDEADSQLNKQEMEKPDIPSARVTARAQKRPNVQRPQVKTITTERQRQADGTSLQTRTVRTTDTKVSPSGVQTIVEHTVKTVRTLVAKKTRRICRT